MQRSSRTMHLQRRVRCLTLVPLQAPGVALILGKLDDSGATWSPVPDAHRWSATDAAHTSACFQRQRGGDPDDPSKLSASLCPLVMWRVHAIDQRLLAAGSHVGNVHYFCVTLLAQPPADAAVEADVQVLGAL